jgi:hypothetical protein
MVNYSLGKIYRVHCNLTGDNYYGLTAEKTLANRLATHIYKYKEYLKTGEKYISLYKIFNDNDYKIVLVEVVPCGSRDELNSRLQYYIENFDCINKTN